MSRIGIGDKAMIILTLIKKILSWLKDHTKGVILAALGIGATTAAKGVVDAQKAKKINRQALSIRQTALERHENAYQETQQVMIKLGEVEKRAFDSFQHFADTMKRIELPTFLNAINLSTKIPYKEIEEMKVQSIEVQMALCGAGAGSAGALAGLAAFGAGAIIVAPAIIGAGVVLCVKGSNLKKKAVGNKKQAKQLEKSVDEIVVFYSEVKKTAESFRKIVDTVYNKYIEGLQRLEETLKIKTGYKQFTRQEKKNLENTIKLAILLCKLVKAPILIKQNGDNNLETVNTGELAKLQKEALKELGKMK